MTQQQTPLAKSIQRKIDRIKELEKDLSKTGILPHFRGIIKNEIEFLNHWITEDKKLLPEERENMIDAKDAEAIVENGKIREYTAEEWFNDNYTQEIQEG